MPQCELITIGSELLNGSVLNTNAQFLSGRITRLGIEVVFQTSCRDCEREIIECLKTAFLRSDLVFVTGGLGPTPDDITREAVGAFFRCGLKFDQKQYRHIVRYFKKFKKTPPFMTKKEAFLPEIAKPLLNRFGIALGFYVESDEKLTVVLPGVPRELINMYNTVVEPLILNKFKERLAYYTAEAHLAGLYETQVMQKLGKGFFKNRDFEFGIYPEIGEVTIRIKTQDLKLKKVLEREMGKRLKPFLYSLNGCSLAEIIGSLLVKRKFTLSVAESCTAGLLAERLTDFAGSSQFFKGGIIAYHNRIKTNYLDISKNLLEKKGAVSKEVCSQMAKAIRLKFDSSIGISITGIAGPSGGSPKKPVGLVYIGLSDKKRTKIFDFLFSGERSKIRLQAAQKALFLLYQWLIQK